MKSWEWPWRGLIVAWWLVGTAAFARDGLPAQPGPAPTPPGPTPAPAAAGTPAEPQEVTLEELLTLEEVLNAKSTVASTKARKTREAAGVITVISREEIVSAGARDLVDVLRLVPGFSLASDVQGVVGPAFRGIWGYEGKVLLMIDGLELNELLYSTVQLGQHYPMDAVERVEIIRGPGSAIYGGHAELAVINVITRSAAQLNGLSATGTYSQAFEDFTARTLSLAGGKEFESGVGVSLSASAGQGNRSVGQYTDFANTSFAMNGVNRTDPLLVNGALTYRGLKVRLLFDRYRAPTRDGLDFVLDRVAEQTFTTFVADAQYRIEVNEKLTLTPRLTYTHQLPWQVLDADSPLFYDKTVSRLSVGLVGAYDITPELTAMLGVEGRRDQASLNSLNLVGLQTTFAEGATSVSYLNVAAYAQVLWDNPLVNVTVGARYELNSAYGSSFVPRIGLTKVIDRFHAKLLYSQAFRAPGIENIRLNAEIKPERTHTLEAEVGYQFGEHVFGRVNAFDITIERPIVYFYDSQTSEEAYRNEPQTGSRGVEVELRFKHALGWANLSWAFATNGGKGSPPSYALPGRTDVLAGMPAHTFALNGGWTPAPGLSINPSASLVTPRLAYLSADDSGTPVLGTDPTLLLVNLFVSYQLPGLKGVQVGAGVYNLLDARVLYLQPYNGGHAPLPGAPRELIARLSYKYAFD